MTLESVLDGYRNILASVQDQVAHLDKIKSIFLEYPEDIRIYFELANACDFFDREEEARTFYEIVFVRKDQLPEKLQPALYLQYGSTLRNLSFFAESVKILEDGCRLFPDHGALKIFKSMALHSAGDSAEAIKELWALIASDTKDQGISDYKRAIDHYMNILK